MKEPVEQACNRLNPYNTVRYMFFEQGFMLEAYTGHWASPFKAAYDEGKKARYLWQYGGRNEN